MNGGMYQDDFRPVGLYIENGRELIPANTATLIGAPSQIPNFYKKPNGVFYIGDRKAGIADYRAFAKDVLSVIKDKPISFEVFCDDFSEMERQAREIAGWGAKLPTSLRSPRMIVRREGRRLRLVTQSDHAAFAGDLLALFRLPEIAGHPRRADLLRAVRLHDNGWRELDASPPVDAASGLPHSFLDLPRPLRLEVWERGTARYVESDPYTALLTTEHALTVFAGEAGAEGWRELLPRLADRRRELLSHCGLDSRQLAADYRFLDLADRLSLAVCNGWSEPFARHGVAGRLEEEGLALSPFPLAGATTFEVACRWIEARRYAGDGELTVALASARWASFPQRVVPPRDGSGGDTPVEV